MSHFDDFFRANYRGMVRYCSSFGFSEADVEEIVSDVMLKHYDDYRSKIEGPSPDTHLRHWMNRRVLLDLKHRYSTHPYARTGQLSEHHDQLTFDDPQEILDLKQRLPQIHPILVTYEQYGGDSSARGENSSADKTRFCRERKKFLNALNA